MPGSWHGRPPLQGRCVYPPLVLALAAKVVGNGRGHLVVCGQEVGEACVWLNWGDEEVEAGRVLASYAVFYLGHP